MLLNDNLNILYMAAVSCGNAKSFCSLLSISPEQTRQVLSLLEQYFNFTLFEKDDDALGLTHQGMLLYSQLLDQYRYRYRYSDLSFKNIQDVKDLMQSELNTRYPKVPKTD